MRQVRLGQTDLQVSVIAFGTWAFGGDWAPPILRKAETAIHHALDVGIQSLRHKATSSVSLSRASARRCGSGHTGRR
jgi:predicted oxidoreductase